MKRNAKQVVKCSTCARKLMYQLSIDNARHAVFVVHISQCRRWNTYIDM